MASGMKAVSSMLFDLEDTQAEEAAAAKGLASTKDVAVQVASLVREAAQSVPQVANVLAQLTQQDDLVAASQALGYSVRLRDCVGGGAGAACLHNLHHSFLILSPSAHCTSARPQHAEEIIIDPTFRDQFVIAHPSARYQAVLDALPPVFIGTASTVQPLVELLCAEMAAAFQAAGIVLPPWRSLRSMMTKWMPRRSLDLPLPACACPAAATGQAPASAGAAAGTPAATGTAAAAGNKRNHSLQLLRQACLGTNNTHSSVGDGSTASGMHSASSSNCSSASAEATHSGLLQSIAGSVGGNSEPEGSSPAAAAATDARGNGHVAGTQVSSQHTSTQSSGSSRSNASAKQAPLVQQAIPCPTAARRGVACFEPLHRVVGGFPKFGTTPL